MSFSRNNLHSLDKRINQAVSKIFGGTSYESIRTIRYNVGLPNLQDSAEGRRLKFVNRLFGV